AVHGHRALGEREGGRPMFEASALRAASIDRGLVFVGTDQGFALGHDPGVKDPWRGVLVARERNDAHDLLLWERFGRPPAYRYSFDPSLPSAEPRLLPFEPELSATLRYEAEAEWPALSVSGGSAYPAFDGAACVSRGSGLRLARTGEQPLSVRIELTPREAGPYEIRVQWLSDPPASVRVELEREPLEQAAGGSNGKVHELAPSGNGPCFAQAIGPAELRIPSHLKLVSTAQSVLVDYIELRPAASKMR
ncbi:MAG TPA: hypothetical protein VGP93_19335, partial [Polyangiaceae bacterium]|nr:hypothetical protein [Polyangiaceae bacterium]